ncbi:MAG TPA: hypothetical protein VJV05_15120 [Pyrinomonadaceae bacterium]|nr:hypothetical protein [Pyrinomonadaceae bacterium]
MEKTSFDSVYNQVAWELCVEAAAKAKTELAFSFFADKQAAHRATPVPNVQTAAEKLIAHGDGGIRISGSWLAGGKQGILDLICDERFAPTITETYIVRLIEDRIRMQIAKKLFARGAPSMESLEGE